MKCSALYNTNCSIKIISVVSPAVMCGGNRKFILVEQEDYANEITAERVRRVIDRLGDSRF